MNGFTLLLIIIASAILLVYFFSTVIPAYSQNATETSLRQEVDKVNEQYGFADDIVVRERENVRKYTAELEQAEIGLIKAKSDARASWDAIGQIEIAEQRIITAQENLDRSNELLSAALNEKEQLFNKRNELQKQVGEEDKKRVERTAVAIESYTKLVGVKLSQNCIVMIKNNITSNCPTYEELSQLDTSNTEMSGEFGWSDGWYHRHPSKFKDGYRWYDWDNEIRILVDPPSDHQHRIKMITIENNFDKYVLAPSDNKLRNNTITLHHDRSVKDCRTAQITTDDWESLLPDTIHYLRTDCTVTNFDEKIVNVRDDTPWDYEDCQWCKYRTWLETAMLRCLGLC